MKLLLFITLLTGFLFSTNSFSANKAAKVLMMRGKVTVDENGKKIPLKKGMWVKEKAKVTTSAKSFVKLLFIDKSSMNLGPNSKMVIDAFPKKKSGIITLLKGQLRSKVTKNYMDMKDKNKSKLFIKTPTAAMGIRGTDFQVNYNPKNRNTSLITYSGAVAMAQLPQNYGRNPGSTRNIRNSLEAVVSSPTAVMVKKGQISGVMPGKTKKAMKPVKMHPGQHEAMKHNDGTNVTEEKRPVKKKQVRSIVPAGMPSDDFANKGNEMDKQMEAVVGVKAHEQVLERVEAIKTKEFEKYEQFTNNGAAPLEDSSLSSAASTGSKEYNGNGMMFNKDVVGFIPPDQDAMLDTNTGTLATNPEMGRIDPSTGDWEPTSFVMTDEGGFVPMEAAALANGNRMPASADGTIANSTTSGGEALLPPPPEVMYNQEDLTDSFIETNMDMYRDPATADILPDDGTCGQLCQKVQREIQQEIQDTTIINNSTTGKTPVQIIINAQ